LPSLSGGKLLKLTFLSAGVCDKFDFLAINGPSLGEVSWLYPTVRSGFPDV